MSEDAAARRVVEDHKPGEGEGAEGEAAPPADGQHHHDRIHGGDRRGEVTATGGAFSLPERGTKHLWQKIAYFLAYCIYVPSSLLLFRTVRVERKIPRKGGALMLSNHTSVMDPAWVAFHSWRPDVHFMASSTLFNIKWLALLIQALGAFPKAKQVKDRGAMALMTDIYERGGIIMMFPEGERTWDGRTVPPLPGIGRLLKKRGYQVITARNLSGYFFQPRWAKYPRYVPIKIEYDLPTSYPDTMSAQEIADDIGRRISVDMRGRKAPRGSFGWRMAHGLPGFLWACPSCFTPESLQLHPSRGNFMVCRSCGEEWRVDVSAWIHPTRGGGEGMPVYEAYDRVIGALTPEKLGKREDESGRPIILECPRASVVKMVRKGHTETVAEGIARLVPGLLQLLGDDGEVRWQSPISEFKAINLDVGSQLFLRYRHDLYRLDPAEESRVKWAHFLRHYHPDYNDEAPLQGTSPSADG